MVKFVKYEERSGFVIKENLKKPYESPNVNIVLFEFSDIVTQSTGIDDDSDADNKNVNNDAWN